MFRDLIEGSQVLDLPVLAMLFFFAVFTAVLVRVMSRRRRAHYDRMSQLPLEDGTAAGSEPQGVR